MYRADYGLLFGDGASEWFFSVDVFLARGGFSGDDRVPVIGNGDHDGVYVVACEHLAIVMERGAVLVAVVRVDGIDRLLQVILFDVARGHDLAVVEAEK